ncbi:hypothetical protein ACFQO7_26380 [Catellatospora aurea]|uniref:Uncharacterized protein n=1 Tax=Catellatospora aurea TaxID=1337874 RepID=A0ABW2H1C8_9ACTN
MFDLADDNDIAQAQTRHLLAVTHLVVTRVFEPAPGKEQRR